MDRVKAFEAAAKAIRSAGRGAYFYAAAFRGAWTEPFTTAQAAREEAARKAFVECEGCGNKFTPGLQQPCYACRLTERDAAEDVAEPSPYYAKCCQYGCDCGDCYGAQPDYACECEDRGWRIDRLGNKCRVIADAAPLDPSSSIPAWQPADGEGGEVDSGIHPPPTSPHPNLLAGDVPRPSPAGTTSAMASLLMDILAGHQFYGAGSGPCDCGENVRDHFDWREHVAPLIAARVNAAAADERVTDRLDGVSPAFHHWFDAAATFPQYQKRTEK